MAAPATLPALLESLTQSLTSASDMTPQLTNIAPPKDGLSLLDVKNELLLSYLQNLVFLILLKIRNARKGAQSDEDEDDLSEAVREKLVELRLFLEKGARPLEAKLQYSITQFLNATERHQQQEKLAASKRKNDSEDEDEDEDDEDDSEEEDTRARGRNITAPGRSKLQEDVKTAREKESRTAEGKSGVYQPPKRERKVMDAPGGDERRSRDRRGGKSHTMDEYVATELSAAPLAEPSIGTTIVQGGRRMKSASERKEEDERREYEESNFVRLPAASKKERAKKNRAEGRSDKMQFGGEEWRGLGEGVDRIDRLTRRRDGGGRGGGVRALLDKSRKRGPETTDGPRGSGMEMGERFHKRAKMLETGRRR
ncbi:sas10/Utp3/C1D family protein [Sarocladium implicatum]|jgi:U3 small nucleolar ribonucleoprotein protein LCP5|nr:sas10/Utp3/C1D family protein [Sarocladium implicatum]